MAAGDLIISHGGVFKMDNAAGSLTDYSDDVQDCTADIKVKRGNGYHVASTEWEQQVISDDLPKAATASVKFVDTEGATDLGGALRAWHMNATDAARTIEVYDPDATAGSKKISGEFVLVNPGVMIQKSAGSGNARTASASFKGHGTIAYTVIT